MKIKKSKLKNIIKEEFKRKIAPQTQDIFDRAQAERYAKKLCVPVDPNETEEQVVAKAKLVQLKKDLDSGMGQDIPDHPLFGLNDAQVSRVQGIVNEIETLVREAQASLWSKMTTKNKIIKLGKELSKLAPGHETLAQIAGLGLDVDLGPKRYGVKEMRIKKSKLINIIKEELTKEMLGELDLPDRGFDASSKNLSEGIDVEKVENINSAIQDAYKQMMIQVKQDQVYANTGEPVSKDPKDMHKKAVEMIMYMVNDAIDEVTPEELKGDTEEGFPSFMEWVEKNDPDLLRGAGGKIYPSLEIAKEVYREKLRQYQRDSLEQQLSAKKEN